MSRFYGSAKNPMYSPEIMTALVMRFSEENHPAIGEDTKQFLKWVRTRMTERKEPITKVLAIPQLNRIKSILRKLKTLGEENASIPQ